MKKQETALDKKVLVYILIVLLFLGGVYLLTDKLVAKNKYKEKTTVDNGSVSIQYSEIILGEVFSKSQKEYLVLCYDKEEEQDDYNSIVSDVMNGDKIKLYTVDLSHAFNKALLTEDKSNTHPTKASELKIKGATLIHIKDKKVVDYIEGKEAITSFVGDYK